MQTNRGINLPKLPKGYEWRIRRERKVIYVKLMRVKRVLGMVYFFTEAYGDSFAIPPSYTTEQMVFAVVFATASRLRDMLKQDLEFERKVLAIDRMLK